MNKLKLFLPATFWLLVILFLSGYPGHKVPSVPFWQFDKLVHTLIYLALSLFSIFAFHRQYIAQKSRFLTVVFVAVFGIFYGGLMEILQHYIFINRSGNWYDFSANTLGAIIGVIVYPYVMKLLPINKWLQ